MVLPPAGASLVLPPAGANPVLPPAGANPVLPPSGANLSRMCRDGLQCLESRSASP